MSREWRRENLGDRRTGYVIRCASRGCSEMSAITGSMGPELAGKKLPVRFRMRGWTVGSNASHDYCPRCTGRFRAISKQTAEREKVVAANVTPLRAEKPEDMTKLDRRTIIQKLEAVYVDENVGYTKGWDDSKVAMDLGVPRAWVSSIREENFGPEKSEEFTKMFEEAAQLLAEIRTATTGTEQAKTVLRTACEAIGKLEPRIQRIERLMKDLEKRMK